MGANVVFTFEDGTTLQIGGTFDLYHVTEIREQVEQRRGKVVNTTVKWKKWQSLAALEKELFGGTHKVLWEPLHRVLDGEGRGSLSAFNEDSGGRVYLDGESCPPWGSVALSE